jgi:hypothetical protein
VHVELYSNKKDLPEAMFDEEKAAAMLTLDANYSSLRRNIRAVYDVKIIVSGRREPVVQRGVDYYRA